LIEIKALYKMHGLLVYK